MEVVSEVVCCVGLVVCSLFCKKKVGGIRLRLYFIVFFFFGIVFCFVMFFLNMWLYLDKIFFFCMRFVFKWICDNFVGYGVVYRVLIVMFMFFLLFLFFIYNVYFRKKFCVRIYNSFWYIKFFLLVLIIGFVFYLLSLEFISKIWMYIGFMGGFMFIFI